MQISKYIAVVLKIDKNFAKLIGNAVAVTLVFI